MSFETRLAAQYSSLFSSGLLAPPRASVDGDRTPTSSPGPSPTASPVLQPAMAPGSPSAMTIDERDTTPTPSSYRPLAPPSPRTPAQQRRALSTNENLAPSSRNPPSIRRRKSSLSLATSPMPMLKSRPSFLMRARSGSMNDAPLTAPIMPGFTRHGSDGVVGNTGLIGRMRSGSLGGAIR
jgi:hypothetical protein